MPRVLQNNYISIKVARVNTAKSWNLMKRFDAVRIRYEDCITNSDILREITWLGFAKYL